MPRMTSIVASSTRLSRIENLLPRWWTSKNLMPADSYCSLLFWSRLSSCSDLPIWEHDMCHRSHHVWCMMVREQYLPQKNQNNHFPSNFIVNRSTPLLETIVPSVGTRPMGCTMEFILAKGEFFKSTISETFKALLPCTFPSNMLFIHTGARTFSRGRWCWRKRSLISATTWTNVMWGLWLTCLASRGRGRDVRLVATQLVLTPACFIQVPIPPPPALYVTLRKLLIQLFAQILFLIFTVHSVYYHKNCYNIINATHAGHTYQAINKQIQQTSKKM